MFDSKLVRNPKRRIVQNVGFSQKPSISLKNSTKCSRFYQVHILTKNNGKMFFMILIFLRLAVVL